MPNKRGQKPIQQCKDSPCAGCQSREKHTCAENGMCSKWIDWFPVKWQEVTRNIKRMAE